MDDRLAYELLATSFFALLFSLLCSPGTVDTLAKVNSKIGKSIGLENELDVDPVIRSRLSRCSAWSLAFCVPIASRFAPPNNVAVVLFLGPFVFLLVWSVLKEFGQ